MKLDAEGRTLRAKKAAHVQVKKRQAMTHGRDVKLIKAYRWLVGWKQSKKDSDAGISFLLDHGLPPNLPEGETVWTILAKATGLTTKRIRQIVKASERSNELARFPYKQSFQLDLL